MVRVLILTVLVWIGSSGEEAAAQGNVFDPVKKALSAGNSKEVARYLDSSVEVTIQSDINSYSKAQAEFVLKNFFQKNRPSGFSIVHTGSSNGGSQYAIGNYMSGGSKFTVLIRVKQSSGNHLIHEISFVKE